MITDAFQWEDTHLPAPLAQVTASDDQVRPLAEKSEAFSLMGFIVAFTTTCNDSMLGVLCQQYRVGSQ